jgi:hypothetical protein
MKGEEIMEEKSIFKKGEELMQETFKKGKEIMEEKGIFGGIDPSMMTEDVLKLIRFSFDVAFDNVVKVQDFNVKILRDMLEKGKDVQSDTVKVVSDFIESARKGRDEYKKMITEGLDKVGEIITKTIPKK